jgi:uncharacterized membrane protein YfcA
MNPTILFCLIGIAAGLASGFFGIGGGIIIVPALVYFAGFSQVTAVGTSLAILLPPVGLLAVIEYYRRGHVDIKAALIIAAFIFVTAWVSSFFVNKLSQNTLKFMFGIFLSGMGIYIAVSTGRVLFK